MNQFKLRCVLLLYIFNTSLALLNSSPPLVGSNSRLCAKPVEKTETEWRELLTPDQFYVLREEGTEAPNTSSLLTIKEPGTFSCAACGAPLFTTETKYESGTGWPSFYSPVDNESIALSTDFKLILPRTECSCNTCGGHLGHVFEDGPEPTGQRFCMNGVAMKFTSDEEDPDLAAVVLQKQKEKPYKIGLSSVLPSVFFNGIIGGLFFNSFVTKIEVGALSPLDSLSFLAALYYGQKAVRSCSRLS